MNYSKIYDSLIERARNRNIDGYVERHHVVPRCMGGSDDASNLVKLTPEEHYLAHQLLIKIYPNNKSLIRAAMMMIPKRPSNKLYGWLKRKAGIAQSDLQQGSKNSQAGTVWIYSDELQVSKKIHKNDPLPVGWERGRKMNFIRSYCVSCGTTLKSNKMKYCSTECKKIRIESYDVIDKNIDDMILLYENVKSITKVLEKYGMFNRKGNKYFSKILKDRGISVLTRRNSNKASVG